MNDAARSQFGGQHTTRWGRERQMYRKVKTDDYLEDDNDPETGIQMGYYFVIIILTFISK